VLHRVLLLTCVWLGIAASAPHKLNALPPAEINNRPLALHMTVVTVNVVLTTDSWWCSLVWAISYMHVACSCQAHWNAYIAAISCDEAQVAIGKLKKNKAPDAELIRSEEELHILRSTNVSILIDLNLHRRENSNLIKSVWNKEETRVRLPPRSMMSFFLFATASRPSLGPTQPPVKWVPGACSPRIMRPGAKLITHLHPVPRLRMRGAVPPLSTSSWPGA
jgi:hypothetical protein